MITHFLGREEVSGYCKDLLQRLALLGSDKPTVWCPLGNSGDHLTRMLALQPNFAGVADGVDVLPLCYNKVTHQIALVREESPVEDSQPSTLLSGKYVLILDSSVHSGASMKAAAKFALDSGASGVLTYTLVMKQGSGFIPNLFGVIVGDHDRALFLLDSIPNNRLFNSNIKPVGQLRQLVESDCKLSPGSLDCGVASIDKITWGDLWYEHQVHGYQVYVIEEHAKLAAFIKLKIDTHKHVLFVDVLATDKLFKGKKVGGALMRWAESLARSNKCRSLELWSIANMQEMYAKMGFEQVGESLDLGGGEIYFKMRRRLLYHFDLAALTD